MMREGDVSDVADLNDDVEFVAEGMLLRIGSSKTDQDGE